MPLLPGSLWPGVVVPVRVSSMGQTELFRDLSLGQIELFKNPSIGQTELSRDPSMGQKDLFKIILIQ